MRSSSASSQCSAGLGECELKFEDEPTSTVGLSVLNLVRAGQVQRARAIMRTLSEAEALNARQAVLHQLGIYCISL